MADLVPWVEKFRPLFLNDVVGNVSTVDRLKAIAKDGNMPNLVIAGPPGTGKTTSVLCLARNLLGDHYKDAVLELNASDDRGIDTVRNKIKMFAQKKVSLPPGRHKIVILDEADSMTGAAQQAMRRTMEVHSHTTRFALACNTSSKIIEPIQSRCAILRYTRLSEEEITECMLKVIATEEVTYDEPGLHALLFVSDGDMRQALNSLQACHSGFGLINQENVFKVCDQPHPAVVKKMLGCCLNGDFAEAHKEICGLYNSGYSAVDLIATVFKVCKVFDDKLMPEATKLAFIRVIGLTHMRIADGVNSRLQLQGMIAKLCTLAK